jgi:undecaprenyl-diphosphatase
MTNNNEFNASEDIILKYEANNSNSVILDVDKPLTKDPLKKQKRKVKKQAPIKEKEGQFDIVETKSICLRIKILFIYLDRLDKKISKPLQTYTPNILIEFIFLIFAKLFNTYVVMIYLLCLLISAIIKYTSFYVFLIPFIYVFVGGILTILLKAIIGRNRPTLTVKRHFNNVRNKEKTKSMPSGDSWQAANFAMMIILYFDWKYKYFALLFIPASMSGRVFFNCHYWFDCIIGAMLGIIFSLFTYYIINQVEIYLNIY